MTRIFSYMARYSSGFSTPPRRGLLVRAGSGVYRAWS